MNKSVISFVALSIALVGISAALTSGSAVKSSKAAVKYEAIGFTPTVSAVVSATAQTPIELSPVIIVFPKQQPKARPVVAPKLAPSASKTCEVRDLEVRPSYARPGHSHIAIGGGSVTICN